MPREVVVYAGYGSSHSWTWLADLFEANSVPRLRFLDEFQFVRSLKACPSTVIVSGGDAYAIASALSGDGFTELKRFIASGGDYIGICAGAYLPLPTRVPPLSEFNICSVKIENIARLDPESRADSPRLGVPYCDRLIVHPARGEVELRFNGGTLNAPVYGGPVFREPSEGRVIVRFSGFADSTQVQVTLEDARAMVLGKPAVVETRYGDGRLLLFSPHLEHPGFPEANRLFTDLLGIRGDAPESRRIQRFGERVQPSGLSRAIADLSVALRGLEGRSFLVGSKLWDVERLMVLADAVRRRAPALPVDISESLSVRVRAVRDSVVDIRSDDPGEMDAVLVPLMGVARDCVNVWFEKASPRR